MKYRLIRAFKEIFDLKTDAEKEHTIIENVWRDVEFKGTNVWLLAFAIFIASIGLNVNSTAVIIGAMLVSPLMGPIVGAGLALGMNDFALLKKSFINLLLLTVISIFVSTLYFLISPISSAKSELLARIHPTIYDVLIAFFGGLAGIVGASRVRKGNVVPGVAIATALMPPLCTTGYGLATGQWTFFFGAFYLYLINCTFICISTFLIIKYLRFSSIEFLDKKQSVKIKRIITSIIICMLVPAIYFAWQTVKQTKFEQQANKFIIDNFQKEGHTIIYKNIKYRRPEGLIEVLLLSRDISEQKLDTYKKMLPVYGLHNTELRILDNVDDQSISDMKRVLDQLNTEKIRIREIEKKLSVASFLTASDNLQLLKEMQLVDEHISKLASGILRESSILGKDSIRTDSVYIIYVYAKEGFHNDKDNKDRLTKLLQTRTGKNQTRVEFIVQNP